MTLLEAPPAIEIIDLEEMFNEDITCQMNHRTPFTCTVKVTHQIVGCSARTFMCAMAAEYKLKQLAAPATICVDCARPAVVCWTINKI